MAPVLEPLSAVVRVIAQGTWSFGLLLCEVFLWV